MCTDWYIVSRKQCTHHTTTRLHIIVLPWILVWTSTWHFTITDGVFSHIIVPLQRLLTEFNHKASKQHRVIEEAKILVCFPHWSYSLLHEHSFFFWNRDMSHNKIAKLPRLPYSLRTLFVIFIFLQPHLSIIYHLTNLHRALTANNITTLRLSGIENMKNLTYLCAQESMTPNFLWTIHCLCFLTDSWVTTWLISSWIWRVSTLWALCLFHDSDPNCYIFALLSQAVHTIPDRNLNNNCLNCDDARSLTSAFVYCSNDTQGGARCENGLH